MDSDYLLRDRPWNRSGGSSWDTADEDPRIETFCILLKN